MKKALLIIYMLCCTMFSLEAQLADGSIAPDFTATDINGVEHNLYDLLNQGKTIILDVSATWCPPCWSFHTAGVLDDLWHRYGPDGTDELYIFMIEGDGSTSLNDLYGTGGNTMGDWVTGTPYPIIDAAFISSIYDINFYPTLYQVCADRTVINLSQNYDPDGFFNDLTLCNPLQGNVNGLIRNFKDYNGATCGDVKFTPEFVFQNMGNDPITSASFEVYVNGALEGTRNWVGNLNSYGHDEISLDEISFPGSFELSLEIASVNGGVDDFPSNNTYVYELDLPKVADNSAQVVIKTDNYGNELYWILYSPTGQIVGSGGNQAVGLGNVDNQTHTAPDNSGAYPNNAEIVVDIQLEEEGCHFLLISDYYGDGLCCHEGEGYFRIIDSKGGLVLEASNYGGNFNIQFDRLFFSSNEDLINETFSVHPNPSNGIIQVGLEGLNLKPQKLTITDLTGKMIYTEQINSSNSTQLSLDIAEGFYFVHIYTAEGIITEPLVIAK